MTWEFETTLAIGWTLVLVGTAWPEAGDFGYEVDRVDVYFDESEQPHHTSRSEPLALELLGDKQVDLHQHIREEMADAGMI